MNLDFSFIDRMTAENNSAEHNRRWMAGYTPRPSDVYICTYPKSGTHWAMQAAQQIDMYAISDKFDLLRKTDTGCEINVLRSGRVGNSAELLTSEHQTAIDSWNLTELKRLNCDFPYDHLFRHATKKVSRKNKDQ